VSSKQKIIQNIEARNSILKATLFQKEKSLKDLNAELKLTRSSSLYQINLRKQQQLKKKEESLEKHSYNLDTAKITQLKAQVHSLQTLVSDYKMKNSSKTELNSCQIK